MNKQYKAVGRNIIKKYRASPSPEALETGEGVAFDEFLHFVVDNGKRNT